MKVMVTGGSGWLGRRIVSKLLDQGMSVVVLTRKNPPNDSNSKAQFFQGDITDFASVVRSLEGCNAVIHCAAEKTDPLTIEEVNVYGTENILEASKQIGIQYFCHLSSVGVYGQLRFGQEVGEESPCCPMNAYEATKLRAEQKVRKGIPGATSRPSQYRDRTHSRALPHRRPAR